MRAASANVLSSATQTAATFTVNQLNVGNNNGFSTFEWFNGRIWNVKVWGRALSAAELLVESYYYRPQFPNSINVWWPLPNAANTNDYSGNARNPTVGGTLTTEDGAPNGWRPNLRRIFIPAPATGLTINATTAALTFAGQTATVKRNRLIAATTPALTLAGQSATVKRNRLIAATTPALTLAGQSATVKRNRLIAATTAAPTFVGQTATIPSGKVISATTAALTFVGQTATIVFTGVAAQARALGAWRVRVPALNRKLEKESEPEQQEEPTTSAETERQQPAAARIQLPNASIRDKDKTRSSLDMSSAFEALDDALSKLASKRKRQTRISRLLAEIELAIRRK
jgi:hypothetical protein